MPLTLNSYYWSQTSLEVPFNCFFRWSQTPLVWALDSKRWPQDDKHLLPTVCSTAVANSLKVPTSRQILPMRFASLKLFSVAYLELYLGRKFKTQKIENKLLSTFPYSVGTKTWQLRDAKRDIIETGFNQSSEHEASSSRRENVKCIVMWISWWIINTLKVSWCQGIIATTARDSLLTQSGNLSSHKLLFWIHKRNQQCMQPLEKKKDAISTKRLGSMVLHAIN